MPDWPETPWSDPGSDPAADIRAMQAADRLGSPTHFTPVEARRMNLLLRFEGPFCRLSHWLWKFVKDGDDYADDPPEPPPVGWLRNRLALWCLDLDHLWREHYVKTGREPHERWRLW